MRSTNVRRTTVAIALSALAIAPALAQTQVTEYYHLDGIGNVRVVTNQQGQVVERHDYLPFGEECTVGNNCGGNEQVGGGQAKKFTGKERDTETGLDYFGARYYGSKIGRFTTVDPNLNPSAAMADAQRWNRYTYGLNNPLRFVDPDGRDAVWVKHADGTATLVIPVTFSGEGATEANKAAIISHTENLRLLDPKVSIQVIDTDKPIKGKLNHFDISPGLDTKMCGPVGECINRVGGKKGHIASTNGKGNIESTDYIARKGAHELLHMAGIDNGYIEGPNDEQGRRTTIPKPGFTNSNIMTSVGGTEVTAEQLQDAKNNRTTKQCSGTGAQCQ